LLLQEFDLEIKDKKGVENSITDHLSRMQFENSQEMPIDDSLQDDMLYGINRSNPWYADIVNFMVSGYVPPGANKTKLIQENRTHIWDEPYLFRVCSDGLLRRCVPMEEGKKSLRDAIHHHMEDIMGHSPLMQRFSNVDSFGQQCMKTQENSSEDVDYVRGTAISIQEMPCHLSTIFRSNSLMSRESTIWDHSHHRGNASTFWWQ
jgi:hypothetical protein